VAGWSRISILERRGLLDGVDLILDGTDNFETRYLINDYLSAICALDLRRGGGKLRAHHACHSGPHQLPALRLSATAGRRAATCETAACWNALTGVIASLQVADA
jgi:adenylyltransferase/sulfurtransferase